jgi:hypothetical protein
MTESPIERASPAELMITYRCMLTALMLQIKANSVHLTKEQLISAAARPSALSVDQSDSSIHFVLLPIFDKGSLN